MSSAAGSSVCPGCGTTKATTTSPHSASGAPTTATWATPRAVSSTSSTARG